MKRPSTRESHTCLNCGTHTMGAFCSECGQPTSTERYKLRSLSSEIYGQFRKLDFTTTARTFLRLTCEPGNFVHSYLAGKRVGFLNPVKFFFYSFVVNVIISGWLVWLTGDRSFEQGLSGFRYEIVSFVSTVFWGLLWALFFRRSELNTIENIVAAIMFVGEANFLSAVGQLIAAPFVFEQPASRSYFDAAQLVVYMAYLFYFVFQVFRDPWYLLIPKQVVLVVIFTIVLVMVFVGSSLL